MTGSSGQEGPSGAPEPPKTPSVAGFSDLHPIGRGGFSTVFSAVQSGIDRRVAIKVLDSAVSDEQRFLRECRTLGALSDVDGIVAVLQATFSDEGHPCIVMQLMSGGSMAARVRTSGPLSSEEALAAGIRLSAALERAHQLRIYHRDIKPENVLFNQHDEANIADFGIALVDGVAARSQTIDSLSPPHAPPERFAGKESDPASGDVYSLASTLYTAVAGAPPFGTAEDGGMAGLIGRVMSTPVPVPRVPVDPALLAVLDRAMSKAPELRPTSMSMFHADLLAVANGSVPTGSVPSVPQSADTAAYTIARPAAPSHLPGPAIPTPMPAHGGHAYSQSGPISYAPTGPGAHTGSGFTTTGSRPTKTRKAALVGTAAVTVGIIAAGATLVGMKVAGSRAADQTTTTTSVSTTSSSTAQTTATAPTTTTTTSTTSTTRRPTTTGPSTTTTERPTTIPLPISEATTAVDNYLAAGSGYDTDVFASLWEYPIDFYYTEANRNISEASLRERADRFWERNTSLEFSRTGPTQVTASPDGWETSTPYLAKAQLTDGSSKCQTQVIHLGFTRDWLVRTASETGSQAC